MRIDPRTIPLHHFAQPLSFRVKLKAADSHQIDAWKKWLRALSSVLDLSFHVHGDALHLESRPAAGGVSPGVRRELLGWLIGHELVEDVVVVTQPLHPGLDIEFTSTHPIH